MVKKETFYNKIGMFQKQSYLEWKDRASGPQKRAQQSPHWNRAATMHSTHTLAPLCYHRKWSFSAIHPPKLKHTHYVISTHIHCKRMGDNLCVPQKYYF